MEYDGDFKKLAYNRLKTLCRLYKIKMTSFNAPMIEGKIDCIKKIIIFKFEYQLVIAKFRIYGRNISHTKSYTIKIKFSTLKFKTLTTENSSFCDGIICHKIREIHLKFNYLFLIYHPIVIALSLQMNRCMLHIFINMKMVRKLWCWYAK